VNLATGPHISPEALRRGDAVALDAVYRAFYGDVMALLRRGFGWRDAAGRARHYAVRSTFEAEEICHDAFVAFFDQCRRGNFDPSRPPRPYLLRIATNLALRRLGRGSRDIPAGNVEPEEVAPPHDPLQAECSRLLTEFEET
jgi:DNA-directed RNA polymerase specialized sigma24 family protein